MVRSKGIKPNLKKIQKILNMTPPQTIKDVYRLTKRVVAFNRYISCLSEHCLSFLKNIKNISDFKWTLKCQQA